MTDIDCDDNKNIEGDMIKSVNDINTSKVNSDQPQSAIIIFSEQRAPFA